MTNTATAAPAGLIHCTSPDHEGVQRPGNGFFMVPAREFPTFCGECADHADRLAHGWSVNNSTD